MNQFRYNGKGKCSNKSQSKQIRKRKLKITGGYSIPYDETIAQTKQKLREDIESGNYSLGKPIVPKEYKKLTIKNNKVNEESFKTISHKIGEK